MDVETMRRPTWWRRMLAALADNTRDWRRGCGL
jgi:hypothetical protein